MKKIKEYLLITVGFIILSLSAEFFLVPNNIAGGGVMGIAIVVHKFTPYVPVGALMLAMNIILFILAFIVIGSKFGKKTIYASLGFSTLTWALDKFLPRGTAVTHNLLLATIFGTIIGGVGMGMVFNQNSSTGGTDILAKMINKFLHIDIGKSLFAVDFIVTLLSGAAFGAEIGMFSLLSVMINGFVIDNVIEGFNTCKQVIIISAKNSVIKEFIMKELNRGCTIFNAAGGYTGENTYILYTVLNRKEFVKLKGYIRETDRNAFITVSEVREVLGEGFEDILGED